MERDPATRGNTLRLFTPRGEGSDAELQRALGSADTQLFRSVFAFSLTELQSFDTLNDEGARSRIFSAGIVGAGRAARQVIGDIGDQADAVFKPRGRTQLIPVLLRELAERRQATTEARRAARDYPELLREEESRLAEKQRLDAAVIAARRETRRFEGFLGLWSIWNELQEAERQYAALEAIDTFPPDPERRVAEVASRLEAARLRGADASAGCESAEARVEALQVEARPELAALAPEVAAHHETRDLYRNNVTRLHAARAEIAHATEALARALRSLGGNWDEDRLRAFDVSLPQRDRIRAWAERLRKAADGVQFAERDHAAATGALRQAERDVANVTEQLHAAPNPNPEHLKSQEAALQQLRARVADHREREHAAAQLRAMSEERGRSLRLLEFESEAESEAGPDAAPGLDPAPDGWNGSGADPQSPSAVGEPAAAPYTEGTVDGSPDAAARLALLVVALVGLLVAGAVATARPWLGGGIAVIAIAAGFGVAGWLRQARIKVREAATAERRAAAARFEALERTAAAERVAAAERLAAERRAVAIRLEAAERAAAARRRAHAARREAAAALVAEAHDATEHAQREVERVEALIAADAAPLGLRALPTSADLDACERAVAQQRLQAAHAEQLRRGVSDAEVRRAGFHDQEVVAARGMEQARGTLGAGRREWDAWASANGLPKDMSPESALDFVPAVQQARELQYGRDKVRAGVATLEGDVQAWEARAARLLTRAGADERGSTGETGALAEALAELQGRCVAEGTVRGRLAAAETDLRACRSQLDGATSELRRCEAAWAALLVEAGARNEAHYRSRMHTFTERQRLRRDTEKLRRQLTGRIGDGPEADAIRAVLATGAVGEWERERERHESDAVALDQQLEQAIRFHQDAQRRREAVETSTDIAKCEAEEQALLTDLRGADVTPGS